MSMSDSSSLLTESHNMIDGGTNEHNEITLIQIHSLLTKTNSKLTIIETKNKSLEEIEKKITAIGQIRENLDSITSRVNKVELEIKTARRRVSAVSNTKLAEFRSEVCELRQGNSGIIRSLMMLRHCLRPPPTFRIQSLTQKPDQ